MARFGIPRHRANEGCPVWARGVTPVTGKWRLETVEINGRVRVAGVSVDAGDLVVADEAGVVFVPFLYAEAVLVEAEHIDSGDRRQKRDIDAGIDAFRYACPYTLQVMHSSTLGAD